MFMFGFLKGGGAPLRGYSEGIRFTYDKTISNQSQRSSGLAVESVTFEQKVMGSSLAAVKGN